MTGTMFMAAGYLVFLLLLFRLSVEDIRTGFLYDRWVIPLAGVGLLMAIFQQDSLFSALAGAMLGGGLLFLVRVVSRGGIGGGDVKLAAALGIWTGISGILPALFLAFLLGSVWGVVLLLRGCGRKAKLPFGPCLSIGGIVGAFYGDAILSFYETFF
ncbi:MAG: A24 family peptidase [Selenomonadaceae bacterium]|nr:A24 family peptidase [Selenomonadaceae bacterium]